MRQIDPDLGLCAVEGMTKAKRTPKPAATETQRGGAGRGQGRKAKGATPAAEAGAAQPE